MGGGLTSSLKQFAVKLQAWNKHTFGNIFQKKRRLLLRLEGVQKALDSKPTNSLIVLEARLKREWEEVLFQEELLWKQKSRVEWLKERDKNTRLFHLSTLIRRRRKKVDCLLNDVVIGYMTRRI